MLTYMQHEDHGVVIVYDEATATLNEQNGWKVIPDYEKYRADLVKAKQGKTPAKTAPAPAEPAEDNSWLEPKVPAHPHKGKGR